MREKDIKEVLHFLRNLQSEIIYSRVETPNEETLVSMSDDVTKAVRTLQRELRVHRSGWNSEEIDLAYFSLLEDILDNGTIHRNRTGVKSMSVFGRQLKLNLSERLPLLTTKKMFWKGIRAELIWMLEGNTNVDWLHEHDVHIWDEWADETGSVGPIYGAQWRHWWPTLDGSWIDQITNAEELLRNDPDSRRIIVTAWNPTAIELMSLPPCHCLFQFKAEGVGNRRLLHCHMYQRSADVFLGVPFNIASYALLTTLMAEALDFAVGTLTISYGDLHLYENHVEQAKEQLKREPFTPPVLRILKKNSIVDYDVSDIWIEDYESHPPLKAEVAV